jgi:hypothetical protein
MTLDFFYFVECRDAIYRVSRRAGRQINVRDSDATPRRDESRLYNSFKTHPFIFRVIWLKLTPIPIIVLPVARYLSA